MKLEEGSLVADRFEIVRFIAEGGMGEVYEAKDRVLGEHVALKFLSHRNIGDDQIARRFRREIQLARKVTHPNVCRLFDVYFHEVEVPGLPREKARVAFVTMELLSGPTLEEHIQQKGRLSEEEALPIVVQMCQALDAAHAAGIVHRDFKSNNVMLVRDPRLASPGDEFRVVVTDFGLARSTDNEQSNTRSPLTVDQLIIGTADYMAPEQIHGDAVSPQSDLYALGVVMFELITGRKPYSAPNAMQLLVKRINEKPAQPRDFVPTISHLWESTILRCLESDPKDRPLSAREVLRELEATMVIDTDGFSSELRPRTSSGFDRRPTSATVVVQAPSRPWMHPGVWLAAMALVFLAGLILLKREGVGGKGQAGPFNPRRVTVAPGLEQEPVFSPSGEEMVWSGELPDGSFELFIHQLESTAAPRQLTKGDGAAFEPDWSADGKQIIYHSRQHGGLWLTTPQGAQPQQITTFGSRPSFSPDGHLVAFQSESSPLISDTTTPATVPSYLLLLDLDKKQSRPLTTSGQPDGGHGAPVFTPDGRYVIFTASHRSRSEIWAVEVATGVLRPLVRTLAAYDPAITPDGKRLFFSATSSEVKDLWQVEISPDLTQIGEPTQVAGLGVSSVRTPAISKDGKKLLFAAYATRSNLWQIDLDPATLLPRGESRALTYGDDRYSRPTFSRDGKTLTFDFWKTGVLINVWLMNWKTGERHQALRSTASTSHGSFLLDGRVGLTTFDGENRNYAAADPSSGNETLLTELPKDADWAVLSPDGRRLAYHTRALGTSLNIWLRELDSAKPARQITFHENLAGFPVWSHDGKWLAYQVRQGEDTQVWQIEIATGLTRQITFEAGSSWPFSFSPDDTRIAFAGLRHGLWNLYWIEPGSLEQGALTRSSSLTSYLRYPCFSPDAKTLVYEKADTSGDLFLVDGFL